YDLAVQVRELAPWEWMMESDVFGVEMPETRETIFVSVMGALGKYFAVAVYPHADAVRAFWALENDDEAQPERILEISQIHASFEDARHLESEDRRVLKRLGLSFRGKSWPIFRSYSPGFAPWFLELHACE